ncbi:YetF domain-containing protein [Stenotrophomonas sp. MMGLT7]|uniref:DUF421 domain-containing protein n=1 Tax=Stenotrophomonas sp. MMGLT7 TaxID=2901227 RepID=UPI001E53534F|nr:YetF domain-containing protein [Stenotrophomonas sp. MMGLT7]MCD7099883.1 DUF421 domain-containing protein [Stenotrophomonas sp. MMGLT7]
MSDLFDMAMPWYEFVLRAVVVYVVVLALVRLSGKRTVGQFTPFDMLLVVLLGNAVQNSLIGEDSSLLGGLLLAATLLAINYLAGWMSARSMRLKRVIEGEPIVLARDGRVFRQVLRRELVSRADFEEAMRMDGCPGIDKVKLALLETSGRITIIQYKDE